MRSRFLTGLLTVASIIAFGDRIADASIVLSYTVAEDGVARLMGVESNLARAIQLNIEGGDGLFAVLVGDQVTEDGSRLPVLRVRPVDAVEADAAIASEAYLTFSFRTDSSEIEAAPSGNKKTGFRTLEFNVSKNGTDSEFGCFVQSSLDGFGSGRPVLVANPVASEGSDTIRYSVDISQERFQDLSEVDFRVYFYSSTPDEPLVFDGIRLSGEVIVAPEPSSSLVWALTLMLILFVAAVAWLAQRNREQMTYAMATGGRSSMAMRREPWSEAARESIFNIIERGRDR